MLTSFLVDVDSIINIVHEKKARIIWTKLQQELLLHDYTHSSFNFELSTCSASIMVTH